MENQKKNKKLWIIIAVLAAVLLAAVILLIVLTSGGKGAEVQPQTQPEAFVDPVDVTEAEQTEPSTEPSTEPPVATVPETPDLQIETPYCTLLYPGEWEELLHVEQTEGDVYTVKFFCKLDGDNTIELFSVLFGGEDGMGTVKTADGKLVNVRVKSVEIQPDESWSTSQMNIVFTMQEALNYVLENLELVEVEPTEPTIYSQDETPSDLDTPYGTLKYPARWDEYLVTKVNKEGTYSVRFSAKIGKHDTQRLFTVFFGGDKGVEAGTVKDKDGKEVTVRLSVAEPELDGSWSEDERRILLAMQEDMNYLLSNLPG